jgi:Cu-Zn family superoxide dismutase
MGRTMSLLIAAGTLAALPFTALAQSAGARQGGSPKAMTASLRDAKGAEVGQAEFRQTPNGVIVRVQLRGVPEGTHSMHVHETGRCDAPDFKSAGGHFAPEGHEHGFLDQGGPHAGDLPNVHVGRTGELTIEAFAPNLTLDAGARALTDRDGSALVLHADPDDYHADPAGDAGNRIVCGVIAGKP